MALDLTYDDTLSRVRIHATGVVVPTGVAAVRSTSTATHHGDAFTVPAPAGVADTPVLIVFHSADWGVASQMGAPMGGGTWRLLQQETDGVNTLHTKAWWRVAGATEPATYAFTQDVDADGVVTIIAVEGADPTSEPIVASSKITIPSASVPTPSTTPAGEDDFELRWVGASGLGAAGLTWTPPAGFTERSDLNSDDFTSGSAATRALTSKDPTGVHTFTATASVTFGHGFTVDVMSVGATGTVDVERSTNQVTWETVRGGRNITPDAGEIFLDDYEFAADVVNFYRIPGQFVASITPVLDSVWLKSIVRPFLNRPVRIIGVSEITRPSRGGVFDVVGRSFPVAVTEVRGSRRCTIRIRTVTSTERREFDLILAAGDVMFLQPPGACTDAVPTMYAVIGDTTERAPAAGLRYPRRTFELPLTEVAAPDADVVGATITWAGVLNTYATWADVLAGNPTWADLLADVGTPADVIVE